VPVVGPVGGTDGDARHLLGALEVRHVRADVEPAQ
jgi:hypothetical protein